MYPSFVNFRAQPAHPLMKRIVMTGPRAPQWPLAPALRFGAFALLFAAGAMLTKGWWLSFMMWFIAVVLLVFAAIKLAKNWGRSSRMG